MGPASSLTGPFAAGSVAAVVFHFRRLFALVSCVYPSSLRAAGLVHLAALAAALERRFLGRAPEIRDDTVAGEVLAVLRALPPARDSERSAVFGLLADHLATRLASPLPPSAYFIERCAQMASSLVGSRVALRAGVSDRARFVASLDHPEEAALYRPSLPLFRELLVLGDWASAEVVLRGLDRAELQNARALWAIASYSQGGLSRAEAQLSGLRSPLARRHALLGIVGAALARGRVEDAQSIAARAPSAWMRAKAMLAIASWMGAVGQRSAARRMLVKIQDRRLAHEVEILRARLDLDAGLGCRARKRIEALPRSLQVIKRREALPMPRLPGEPDPVEGGPERALLLLRLELALVHDERGYFRQELPMSRALANDPALQVEACASARLRACVLRAFCASDSRPRRKSIESILLGASIVAEARALVDMASSLSGTMAELEQKDTPTPEEAFALGMLGPASAWDACRRDPRFFDPLGPARTHFDEGVASSPRRERRRTALFYAAKASLGRLATLGRAAPTRLFDARLRILCRLDRAKAADALAKMLEKREAISASYADRALFGALVEVDAKRAAELFWRRNEAFLERRESPRWAVAKLEGRGAIDRETGTRYGVAVARVDARMGSAASAWVGGFVRAFIDRMGSPPGAWAFSFVEQALDEGLDLSEGGGVLLERLAAEREAWLASSTESFLRRLSGDPRVLCVLRALEPAASGLAQLSEGDWQELVKGLRSELGEVALSPLRTLAPRLKGGQGAIRALLCGAAPTPELESPIALGRAGSYDLRWLDKRRDFAPFLRFADCVSCCYCSDSVMYRSRTQRMILALWKDPLSFCFQVRRVRPGGIAEPRGFVFGSFGLTSGGAVALLNGIYLKRQSAWLRVAVARAIESAFCKPLGMASIALAARYGGRGVVPEGYSWCKRRVLRLRALCDPNGMPMTEVYDDLCLPTNREATTDYGVAWKDLAA